MNNTFWVILLGAALFAPNFGEAAGIADAPMIESSTITLRWQKSPSRDVKGYRLHYGTSSVRRHWKTIDVGNVTTYKISNLIGGKTYYFVVTAYNAAGKESPASNEISFTVSASVPTRAKPSILKGRK